MLPICLNSSVAALFKFFRITILMFVLLAVTIGYFNDAKQRGWEQSLWVTIYPVNGESHTSTNDKNQKYIDGLGVQDFTSIAKFIADHARHWKVNIEAPVVINLGPEIKTLPPELKENSLLNNALYSLQLRYWAWRNSDNDQLEDIQIFVVYFDSESHSVLPHSLGLEKGKIGLVNAFSSKRYQGSNNFIIAHELLHTLGARDKYDLATNQPLFPAGFANPNQEPLFPQSYAEIMGGRIPLSRTRSEIPSSLNNVTVGILTATEIGWYP